MHPCRMPFSLLFLVILANVITSIEATSPAQENGTSSQGDKRSQESFMVPIMEEKFVMMVNETRRKLNSFQMCALCTCCGGAKGLCLPSPCCYAINCNIPNRPFGFCSFTPKTCNCFGCHV